MVKVDANWHIETQSHCIRLLHSRLPGSTLPHHVNPADSEPNAAVAAGSRVLRDYRWLGAQPAQKLLTAALICITNIVICITNAILDKS